jgi:UDP-N-acetylmuramate dehydrogenase
MESVNIQNSVSLSGYSTMGLGGMAAHLVTVETRMELLEALSWAQENKAQVLMIGGGSNIVWRDEGFEGLIVVNRIERYETFKEDDTDVYVTIGAGESWDTVVERTAQAGLTGIEALSLIPGTAGATPVQNVGAYGQEISQTLTTVEAFDTQKGDFINIAGPDCGFGYRNSRFKYADRGRFYITAITLHLRRGMMQPPFYPTLENYFKENGIEEYTPMNVRQAVIAIRSSRLPDPAKVRNNGSFFANPIVAPQKVFELRESFPNLPSWPMSDGRAKVPAAWLIEQAGFKNHKDPATGMATWPAQPLVLVNESAKSTADLLSFKQKIVSAVEQKFGITLVQEPELLPIAP